MSRKARARRIGRDQLGILAFCVVMHLLASCSGREGQAPVWATTEIELHEISRDSGCADCTEVLVNGIADSSERVRMVKDPAVQILPSEIQSLSTWPRPDAAGNEEQRWYASIILEVTAAQRLLVFTDRPSAPPAELLVVVVGGEAVQLVHAADLVASIPLSFPNREVLGGFLDRLGTRAPEQRPVPRAGDEIGGDALKAETEDALARADAMERRWRTEEPIWAEIKQVIASGSPDAEQRVQELLERIQGSREGE